MWLALALAPLWCAGASPTLAAVAKQTPGPDRVEAWLEQLNDNLVDFYQDPAITPPLVRDRATAEAWLTVGGPVARKALSDKLTESLPYPARVGILRARLQQAMTVELNASVLAGNIEGAKAWRARLNLPRGVSADEGSLLLAALEQGKGSPRDVARVLTREAITWQTSRVRQLLDEAVRSTRQSSPLPGRLLERLGEAAALADLPAELSEAAALTEPGNTPSSLPALTALASSAAGNWSALAPTVESFRDKLEHALPSLLTPRERGRRERLLLKLVVLVPKEYRNGVRDGRVIVPLEYREAVIFAGQARQILGELTPLWLADANADAMKPSLAEFEEHLTRADALIASKAEPKEVIAVMERARDVLEGPFQISLKRSGTTADIVDEVMLEVRSQLSNSLSAALNGDWDAAKRARLEAYTTFDPELEARLMPRDPQLAVDIEQLFLDGMQLPGVKVLLDRRAPADELEAAYARVSAGLDKAAALLKSEMDPTAAMLNAGSIVLREGLEGLLVLIAILAGLRGPENHGRRVIFWIGIVGSVVATVVTYILSQTILTELRAYGEVIAAVSGLLAIGVLLLITNWLFHQVYWRQWVSTLKATAQGESPWQLFMVGFLVGYREGFETVLFLQSLILDAGGATVGTGVAVGLAILVVLGVAALFLGMRLPYFHILFATAFLIGFVLLTFVGNTIRAMQTLGWVPLHQIAPGSWPAWIGQWLGLYNTWETVLAQVAVAILVLGTWRVSRWRAKRQASMRAPAVPRAVSPA